MSKLIVGFSHSNKKFPILSKLIIWADWLIYKKKTNISHAYIKFQSASWDRDFYYQASGHATNFMANTNFLKLHIPVEEYEIEMPMELVSSIGRACVDREGKSYGVLQNVGILIVWIVLYGSFKKIKIKNPFVRGTNCVEEVGRILMAANVGIIAPDFNFDVISPAPFRDWIASSPKAKRIK